MDIDTVWHHIDRQREAVAAELDDFGPAAWETASLCPGWRVRDVAAHLTLAQTGLGSALVSLVRARGSLDKMILDTAVRAARQPTDSYARQLRAMAGSRRTVPGVTPLEPLTDALVHTQDMLIPQGRLATLDPGAAAASAARSYDMGAPFHAARRLKGVRLRASDADLERGEGEEVVGRAQDLLLLVTGRTAAALPHLHGAGVARLGS